MGVGGYLGVGGTSSLPVCFLPLSFLPLEKWNKFFSLDTFQLFFLEDTIKKKQGKIGTEGGVGWARLRYGLQRGTTHTCPHTHKQA